MRQSRLQCKENYQQKTSELHNDKGVNSRKPNQTKNMFAANNRASKYMKQKLAELKGNINK